MVEAFVNKDPAADEYGIFVFVALDALKKPYIFVPCNINAVITTGIHLNDNANVEKTKKRPHNDIDITKTPQNI